MSVPVYKTILTAAALCVATTSFADDHASVPAVMPDKPTAFVQTIPAQYQPGKGLPDVLAWGESFAEVVEQNATPYRMTTWTPFYANQAALPDVARFDTLFFGIWPSITDFGKGWAGYFENGNEAQAELDEIVVPSNQRSMAAMYSLVPSKYQTIPSNGLIRVKGCELNEDKTSRDAYSVALMTAQMADKAGAGFRSSFMMIPGPGSAPSQENHVFVVEVFSKVDEYGSGYEKLMGQTMRTIGAKTAEVMSCDLPRLYLSNAVYWPTN